MWVLTDEASVVERMLRDLCAELDLAPASRSICCLRTPLVRRQSRRLGRRCQSRTTRR
jgi:hypothetical protein